MSTFQPFAMERMMSKWENVVQYNLSESGVHPATVNDFVDNPEAIEDLLAAKLKYVQANGSDELRERIAALYPGATHENVLVTVGCAEANYNTVHALLDPGDEMVVMLPNYMQIWGVARNHGVKLRAFHLKEDLSWAPDLDELHDAITEKTKLIAICNPNNPTGHILSEAEMDAIVAAADSVGAWLLADEVYNGCEQLTDVETPSFWGRYHKVLATNSLSKAYGLPGLRIGWAVGPTDIVDEIWARHEYSVISTTVLSNKLATIALSPEVRPRLIQRGREYVRRGLPILKEWLDSHEGVFTLIPPMAAPIAFPRYQLDINSTELVHRLIQEKSVFIVPGDHFGMDHYLRIAFGQPPDHLRNALDRIHELLTELQG
jgi:aspartate/methionine/tyrosine aminotransferase